MTTPHPGYTSNTHIDAICAMAVAAARQQIEADLFRRLYDHADGMNNVNLDDALIAIGKDAPMTKKQIEAEARAAIVKQILSLLENDVISIVRRNQIRALAALPPTHVCIPIDLLDALSSEEGAEQHDINKARDLLAASKGDA